ncbi:MAG: rRNA maturation RNase YbeY [Planctomycetota bacterium]|jgi:probable rRNA maturation factor
MKARRPVRRPKPPTPSVIITSSQSAMRAPRKRLTELVAFVAREQGARVAHVDIAVVSTDEITELNRRHLRHHYATDVISFDLSEAGDAGLVAQLVVCGDVAAAQGPLHGYSPAQELMLYVIHGLLHLTGCDDTTVRGRAAMHARQEEVLAAFLAARRRARSKG